MSRLRVRASTPVRARDRVPIAAAGFAFAVAVAVLGALVGCSLVVSTSDLTGGVCQGAACDSQASDAAMPDAAAVSDAPAESCGPGSDLASDPKNCGACGKACGAGTVCEDSVCRGVCGGGILYVARTGSDSYDGCTEAYPMATVAAAIARSARFPTGAEEVHVCKGSYVEDGLTITSAAIVKGGYNCSTWDRTDTYGAPTFDGVNETILETSASGGNGVTLTTRGAAVAAGATLDGFTVDVASSEDSMGNSTGVLFTDHAALAITNCHIVGRTSLAAAVYGVHARGGSMPTLAFDLIEPGTAQTVASAFIEASGVADIHDDVMRGGTATTGVARGLQVSLSGALVGDHAVRNNRIEAGNGVGDSSDSAAIAAEFDDTSVEVRHNVIVGGTGTCGTDCQVFGLEIGASTPVNGVVVDSNRITGSSDDSHSGFAMFVLGVSHVQISNNLLYGGSGAASAALSISTATGTTVENNTMFGSFAGLEVTASPQTTFDNNLLLTTVANGVGMSYDVDNTFTAVDNNAFVGFASQVSNSFAHAALGNFDLSRAASFLGSAFVGNIRIDQDCTDETTNSADCIVTPACGTSGPSCLLTLIASWDAATNGRKDVLETSAGLSFVANPACRVTHGGTDVTRTVALDLLGATRSAPLSIGAYEDDMACAN